MNKAERLEYYKKATKKWGWDAQIDQIIEEMAELTVALNKYKRKKLFEDKSINKDFIENIFTELADVSICLEQMIDYFGEESVNKAKTKQLSKFVNQIKTS